MITIFLFFLFSCLAGTVEAISREAWGDFTNNFATDIAPLITLFGEQVTKQFLSESTSFLDSIIFGMAPLGILTAVVALIRISGKSGLKSFVGRASEPHGAAEAELCSSTSDDVCELWSEGSICRVFGRPKIIEFFHRPGKHDFYLSPNSNGYKDGKPGDCNIYDSACFLGACNCSPKCSRDGWDEIDKKEDAFAPYPNLSLNIGFHTPTTPVLLAVSVFAVFLQSSFFIYATFITFYVEGAYEDGEGPQVWAFVLAVVGTVMVVFGMVLCAFLVERKSIERHFINTKFKNTKSTQIITIWTKFRDWVRGLDHSRSFERPDIQANSNSAATTRPAEAATIYWLQPGNQRVGDQQFHAFSYKKSKDSYVTSWKNNAPPSLSLVILTLSSSAIGFVIQFVGFRGVHGSIALYQIAATLVMAFVRALLRWRQGHANEIQSPERVPEGSELDWQALAIFNNLKPERKDENVEDWRICEHNSDPPPIPWIHHPDVDCIYQSNHRSWVFGFSVCKMLAENNPAVDEAIRFIERLEKVSSDQNFDGPNSVAMIARFRSRLGYLTGQTIRCVQPKWDGPVTTVAKSLQLAIQDFADYAFKNMGTKGRWAEARALTWHTTGIVRSNEAIGEQQKQWISFSMFRARRKYEWRTSNYHLEAALSLWAYSLRRCNLLDRLTYKGLLLFGRGGRGYVTYFPTLYPWMPDLTTIIDNEHNLESWVLAWDMQNQRLVSQYCPASQTLIKFRVRSSPIILLAQSLFTIFVSRLATIIIPLRFLDPDSLSGWGFEQDPTGFPINTRVPHIKSLSKLFVQSGLGTEEEALLCIIPIFCQAGILPDADKVKARIETYARLHRSEKESPSQRLSQNLEEIEDMGILSIPPEDFPSQDPERVKRFMTAAIRKSSPKHLGALFDRHADTIRGDPRYELPLAEAMDPGVPDSIMEILLHFDVSQAKARTLHLAIEKKRADIVTLLISHGVSIDNAAILGCIKDKDDQAIGPLDTQKLLTLLLANFTADKTLEGLVKLPSNMSPLKVACSVQNLEAVQILVSWGAYTKGVYLTDVAWLGLGNIAILQQLLNAKVKEAPPQDRDVWPRGTSILLEAVSEERPDRELVKALLVAGADPRRRRPDSSDKTPLEKCREMKHNNLVNILEKFDETIAWSVWEDGYEVNFERQRRFAHYIRGIADHTW